jgi:MFS superfamily sulfate permease-like transporter
MKFTRVKQLDFVTHLGGVSAWLPAVRAAFSNGQPAWKDTLALVRREILAALPFGLALLPTCLASGVFAYSPLGPGYAAAGVVAGLYTIIVGGVVACLVANAGFVISSPRSNLALIQATAATHFLQAGSVAHDPVPVVITAMMVCVLLAGVFQMVFAVSGISRIIKYTPHTVLVGFTNGVALSIVLSILKRFIHFGGSQDSQYQFLVHPLTLGFIVVLALFIFALGAFSKKVSPAIVGLVVGTLIFYGIHLVAPQADLGGAIGKLAVTIPPPSPLVHLFSTDIRAALISVAPDIVLFALAIAVIATFESLLVLRMAQTLADRPLSSMRNLIGQGVGNCASALVGGLAFSIASGQTRSAYRAGGRTRLVPITVSLTIFALTALLPAVLALVPLAAILALLLQNTFQSFDETSLRLLRETFLRKPSAERRRALYDLLVIAVVMGVTVTLSVLTGVLAGVAVTCVIFIVNMSRPIVRRRFFGDTLFSKRTRSSSDAALLHGNGPRRVVLELHGVLFFGNADDLSQTASDLLPKADVIVLDLRGISDIDATGAAILRNLVERCRRLGKHIVFCNVPRGEGESVNAIAKGGREPSVFPDLDTALEWAENLALRTEAGNGDRSDRLPLEKHDFLHGLNAVERETLASHLVERQFPAGTTLCAEGDESLSLWLLERFMD